MTALHSSSATTTTLCLIWLVLATASSAREARSDDTAAAAYGYPEMVRRSDGNLRQCAEATTPDERQSCVDEARALIRALDALAVETRDAAILQAELYARIGAAYDQSGRQAETREDRQLARQTAIGAYQSYVDIVLGQGRLAPLSDLEYARLDRIKVRIGQLAMGQLELTVSPAGARVFVDGDRKAAIDGRLTLELAGGGHSLRVEAAGFASSQRVLDIEADRVTREEVALVAAGAVERPSRWQTTAGWIAAGVAVVGVGVGIGCLVAAGDKEARIDAARGPDGVIDATKLSRDEAQALRSEADTLGSAGAATLAIGGLAAGAAVAFFLWPADASDDGARDAAALLSLSPVPGGFVAGWQTPF